MQVGAVTLCTRGKSIGSSKAAMIEVNVASPNSRMNDKRRSGIEGVTGIAAYRFAASLQVRPVANDAVGKICRSQGGRGMGFDPHYRMGSIIRRRVGISTGTSCQGKNGEE